MFRWLVPRDGLLRAAGPTLLREQKVKNNNSNDRTKLSIGKRKKPYCINFVLLTNTSFVTFFSSHKLVDTNLILSSSLNCVRRKSSHATSVDVKKYLMFSFHMGM